MTTTLPRSADRLTGVARPPEASAHWAVKSGAAWPTSGATGAGTAAGAAVPAWVAVWAPAPVDIESSATATSSGERGVRIERSSVWCAGSNIASLRSICSMEASPRLFTLRI